MKSKYFKLQELYPRDLYNQLISVLPSELLWRMVNPKLIVLIDKIKEQFPKGSITINNYKWSGNREWSGLRTIESRWYSATSQHTLFNAVDMLFSNYETKEVREYLIAHRAEFPELGGLEVASWLHVDVREHNGVLVFDKNGIIEDYVL